MPTSLKRLLVGLAFSALGNGLTIPLLIVYLHDIRGLPTTTAGLVVAWIAGLQFVLTPTIGWLIDRVGPRPVLMQGLLIEASGVACFPFISDVGTAFLFTGLYALGAAHLWPSQTAMIARLVAGQERQRAYGVQFMLLNLGIGLGGLISAVIVNETDPSSFVLLYRLDALTYLAYFAAAASLVGLGGRLPPEERAQAGGYAEVLRDRRLLTLMGFTFVTAGCGWGAQEVGLPILGLLALITALAPPAAAVTVPLKFYVTALLVAWDFLDYPLGQRGLGVRQRLSWIGAHVVAVSVFGMASAAVLLIPGVGLLMLPFGVAGATRLVHAAERG